MKKHFLSVVATVVLAFGLSLAPCSSSHAYTKEELENGKEWLSDHGYSPDLSGAKDAYQDYLDGAFDEEMGLDPNGKRMSASAAVEVAVSGASVVKSEATEESDAKETSTENTADETAQESTEEKATEKVIAVKEETEKAVAGKSDDVVVAQNDNAGVALAKANQTAAESMTMGAISTTLGNDGLSQAHKKAAVVVSVSSIFMLAVAGVLSFRRKKR